MFPRNLRSRSDKVARIGDRPGGCYTAGTSASAAILLCGALYPVANTYARKLIAAARSGSASLAADG